MLDQISKDTFQNQVDVTKVYDLVVIGAGVAGLNALYAATRYLPKGSSVLLLDEKAMAGGMWNTAYDFVRLHQPHPMFTVGDLRWDWRKPRDYLARRDEVRDHLSSSLESVAKLVNLDCCFETKVVSSNEVGTSEGYRARIVFHRNDHPDQKATIEARQAVYAPGLNYKETQPLAFSTDAVASIIPQDLLETLKSHPSTPVYVVGGGKTGMDTVLAVLAKGDGRKVSLINGRGTNFLNRTKYIPNGLKRWTSGLPVSRLFRDLALKFDGDNETQTIDHFRRHHATDTQSPNGVFLYGLQSEEEHHRIASGLQQTIGDYLVDVAGTQEGLEILLRNGEPLEVEPGSIFVNCTGSFFRADEMAEPMSCISPHGTIVSINARDAFHFLTSVAGFFLMHLLYRGELRGRGFYTLDLEALFRKDRNAWVGASAAQAYMNQVIAVQTLPMMLLDRCGLDLDRWYPFPRRMAALYQMKATANEDIAHCRAVLDRVADRFEVRCASLN
ncbi:FAD-dependent oxidoreductase [Shimia abyssi]|uniref:Pyridine nucleotide-disulfide oxidoreductase n=1 Tax=Shimia abyssi TaxID=1662395 RepID=A0A2P8F7U7_9RHOB|nr:FAD-dependent oxidoreductase [Shimia abyssi]PSL17794.1 pyridine nucleotide-disulfide oxidoreductase [Shimia abyssi]